MHMHSGTLNPVVLRRGLTYTTSCVYVIGEPHYTSMCSVTLSALGPHLVGVVEECQRKWHHETEHDAE